MFTMLDLFPDASLFRAQTYCEECGAVVMEERARSIHLDWHNKLTETLEKERHK